jgi:Domain of unknown function (DUF5076)
MSAQDNKPTYDALPVPNEAIENGGIEVLRAALVDDELYVEARRAFKDPAQWGELLADIARRVALLYSVEDSSQDARVTEHEALAIIEEAFAAELGAPVIEDGEHQA